MSQKRSDFQSKPRFGGDKGKKFGDKSRSGGFSKRSEGHSGDRPPRKEFGDRPPRKDFGDRPPRRDFGDRPPRKDFGDRPPRRDFGDRPPRKEFGDRPPRKDFGDRPPRRDFGDRPPRKDFGDRPPRKDFGDRPPRRDFGDRPPRKEFGDRPPRKDFGDRPPRKEFGDRPPRRDFGDRPPRKDFGDRKGGFGGDKDRKFDTRPKKTWTRYEDRNPAPARENVPASSETRQKLKSERGQYGAPSSAFLYGVHAVRAAILNPNRVHQRLLCTQGGFESVTEACQKATELGYKLPEVIYVEKEDIERLLPRDAVHQDLLLDCQPLDEMFLQDVLRSAPDDAKIIVLDQVTDPHNVGAILRSAAAFGVVAVVAQRLHAPEITGTLAKAASGAVEHVPFVREVNLSRALEQMKDAGFFCIGLAEDGKQTLSEAKMSGKVALALGAEGDGLRRLVAETCNTLARLPTTADFSSLNVSNAAAVALYELARG